MTVNFILNGEDVAVQTEADTRLIDILRNVFKLMGTKSNCLAGRCGVCFVILNGKVTPSCLVPAFRMRNSEIITIEGFSQTDDYQDIVRGFEEAGVESCGYCEGAKILVVSALLERVSRPNREEILDALQGILCRCSEPESLVQGVLATVDIRQRRLYGRGL